MRIIICDDDVQIIKNLKSILVNYFKANSLKLPEIETYNNGEDLLNDKYSKDIVFLDIEMPDVSGIYVGNELKIQNRNTIIFIITSYLEYLDDAMKFNVFRYISKPLDKLRIYRNMNDALALYSESMHNVLIETKNCSFTVSSNDIIFVEVLGHTLTVHTTLQDYISTKNMNYWKKMLDLPSFFTSHRSYHINMKYVTSFDHSTIHLYNDKYTAYLARRNYTLFKDSYLLYLESTR